MRQQSAYVTTPGGFSDYAASVSSAIAAAAEAGRITADDAKRLLGELNRIGAAVRRKEDQDRREGRHKLTSRVG